MGEMRHDDYTSASELARLGYCERQVVFDAACGRRTTPAQRQAQRRGLRAHADFYAQSRRIARTSAAKGRCFIATLALGECAETRALRAFRDLYLRRCAWGRWLIGTYYRFSPALCLRVRAWPALLVVTRFILRRLGAAAAWAVAGKTGEIDHER
jgi:hypothetical protein